MTAPHLQTDVAIIGGGIAGLWTLNQLRNRGYSAVLFEDRALGSFQTMGCQGMIHGGIKYALGGALSRGSEAISAMPDIWRACLRGEGKVDLRGCRVLSEDFYLWSHASLSSRVSSFFASKVLRGRVNRLQRDQYPAPLANPAFKGQVYRLVDLVLDIPSLVATLATAHRDAIFSIDWTRASLQREGERALLQLADTRLTPRCLVLTAGAGNEALIQALGGSEPRMQRRPLQQVLVRHEYPEPFYGHCTGASTTPRLTISSHHTAAGEPVWYLGGELADEHTDASPEVLINAAQRELAELLPWIDLGRSEWRTVRFDRAEPLQGTLLRPDQAFVGAVDSVSNTLAAWPTKLTLSPNLADAIETELVDRGIAPGPQPDLAPLTHLGQPGLAPTCWDELFQ